MATLKRTILVFLIALVACFSGPAASAEDAVTQFRIGLINADPGQLLQDFDPFVEYLGSRLRSSGIGDVTVFVARDLDQLRSRIKKGRLDFILTSAFPVVEMERDEVVPAIVAVQGGAREYSALFFVTKRKPPAGSARSAGKDRCFRDAFVHSGIRHGQGRTDKERIMLERSDGYLCARRRGPVSACRRGDQPGIPGHPGPGGRRRFQQQRLGRASPERYSPNYGSFTAPRRSPACSARFTRLFRRALREVVEKTLVEMSGDREGRAALTSALNMTKFERLTEEDRSALARS